MHTSQHVSGCTWHREHVLGGSSLVPVLPPCSRVPRAAGILHTVEHTQTRGYSGSLFRTGVVHICAVVGSLARPPGVQWRKKSTDSHGGGTACGLPPASCRGLCAWARVLGGTLSAHPLSWLVRRAVRGCQAGPRNNSQASVQVGVLGSSETTASSSRKTACRLLVPRTGFSAPSFEDKEMQAVLVGTHNPLSLKGPLSNRVCASGGKRRPQGGEALCPGSHSEPAAPPRTLSPALALPPLAPSPAGLQLLLHVGRMELSSPAGFLLPPRRLPVPLLLWQALPIASSDAAHSSGAWGAVLSSQGSFPQLLILARPSERLEEPCAGQAGACTRVLVAGLRASRRACLLSPLAHLLGEDTKGISGLVAAGGCGHGLCCCCFRGSSPPKPQEGHHP